MEVIAVECQHSALFTVVIAGKCCLFNVVRDENDFIRESVT